MHESHPGPERVTAGRRDMTSRVFDLLARPYDLTPVQRLGYQRNHEVVLDVLHAARPRVVLDVGCGTGILTTRVRHELRVDEVIGVDRSPGMLDRAKERDPHVDFRIGSAESLPVQSDAIDAVISTEAFHFFDQPAALAEFARVLRPGGTVVVVSITSHAAGLMRRATAGAVSAPSRREVRDLVESSGFEVTEQRTVPRAIPGLFTSIATVATLPRDK